MHAPLSPSESERWMNCAGSKALIDSLPYSQSGEAAELGTAVHVVAGYRVSDFNKRPLYTSYDWEDVLGRPIKKVMRVTDDMWWSAGQMAKRALIALYRHFPEEVKWAIEKKVHITKNVWGTADFYVWSPESRHVTVVDFKNGRIPVSITGHGVSKYNSQLMCYVLGALKALKSPDADIALEIVQPNSTDEQYVKTIQLTSDEVYSWEFDVLLPAEARALDPNAKRTPGPSWCEYCKAIDICPEYRAQVQQETGVAFAGVVEEPPKGEQLAAILRWAPSLKAFLEACFVTAQREMEDGHDVPGFKIVRGRAGNRKWPEWIKDPEDLALILCADVADVMEIKVKSPAAVEKILGKHRTNLITQRAEGTLTVVSTDNPRENEQSGGTIWPVTE